MKDPSRGPTRTTGLMESSSKSANTVETDTGTRTKTEVKTSVDNDTNNGGNETSVKTSNTVGSEGLLVDIYQTVELSGSTLGSRLVVVGQSGSCVIKRVDKE